VKKQNKDSVGPKNMRKRKDGQKAKNREEGNIKDRGETSNGREQIRGPRCCHIKGLRSNVAKRGRSTYLKRVGGSPKRPHGAYWPGDRRIFGEEAHG